MQLVAVKADEWRQRAAKVMSQARPQLEVVRQLFRDGQDLGFETQGTPTSKPPIGAMVA